MEKVDYGAFNKLNMGQILIRNSDDGIDVLYFQAKVWIIYIQFSGTETKYTTLNNSLLFFLKIKSEISNCQIKDIMNWSK